MQQPHPPIWIPGVGSLETIEFVAQRRYAYMGMPYFHIDVFRRVFAQFREACQKAGYTADPEQMGWGVPIYVAETDEQAREEFEPHFWYFVRNLLKGIGTDAAGLHVGRSRPLAILKNQQLVPRRAEDLGRHREGRLRHRRQPGDGAAKAGPLPEGAGRRRRADRLPDRHAAARAGPQEHGAARPRGAAASVRGERSKEAEVTAPGVLPVA